MRWRLGSGLRFWICTKTIALELRYAIYYIKRSMVGSDGVEPPRMHDLRFTAGYLTARSTSHKMAARVGSAPTYAILTVWSLTKSGTAQHDLNCETGI